MRGHLCVLAIAAAAACATDNDCGPPFVCVASVCGCAPGSFVWVSQGLTRCRVCAAGCACAGTTATCVGCAGGFYSAAAGAAACTACPSGTTTDYVLNTGCDPNNWLPQCSNSFGILGYSACRPAPPPPIANATRGPWVAAVDNPVESQVVPGGPIYTPLLPVGALCIPPQYLPGGPPFDPNVVPPFYDVSRRPMVQQSY